jgi:hypothetical protein
LSNNLHRMQLGRTTGDLLLSSTVRREPTRVCAHRCLVLGLGHLVDIEIKRPRDPRRALRLLLSFSVALLSVPGEPIRNVLPELDLTGPKLVVMYSGATEAAVIVDELPGTGAELSAVFGAG